MGLSTTIASLIMFYVMIVATVVLAGIFIKSIQVFNNLLLQIKEYKSVDVKINGASVFNSTNSVGIQLNLTNTGNTLIYDFDHCDLIISYVSGGDSIVAVEKYSQYPTNESYKWYIAYITIAGNYSIVYQPPRGLNPTETAIIYANLPSIPDQNSTIKVVFATPKGAESYYEFYYSG